MKTIHHIRISRLLTAGFLALAIIIQAFPTSTVSAAQITTRRLTLQAAGTNGGSKPGAAVNHFFEFTLPSATSVGSIKFQYCTTAAKVDNGLDCNVPTGLSTAAATLGSESGVTGFTGVDGTTTPGVVVLSRGAASGITPGAVSYQLQNITNPSAANETFHVRISTYTALDATGTAIDSGTVTASTARQLDLSGTMPESLVFCTAETVSLDAATSTVPDCSTATDGTIAFNQLFSPTDTATAKSQMAASTNAGGGYAITVNGTTLTSGSNTVTAMAAPGGIVRGTSQFGLNLKANTTATSTVAIGNEVAPASDTTRYKGQASAGYNTVDAFKFANNEAVAKSDDGGAGGSDAQIFTVSYIVNVPGNQPAGTYATTLTYICTPTF
jgi:hypothetical protein